MLDTLSWLKGNHSLKFGYEHRHNSDNFLDIQSLQGQITGGGIYTGNGGLGVPDFLSGRHQHRGVHYADRSAQLPRCQ